MNQAKVRDYETAERLHRAAIGMLRALRQEDAKTGLSAPRLSALSVLVFGGARNISALAAAEQVRLPTMSRLVKELERDGLVRRKRDPADRRASVLSATAAGRRVMMRGRDNRLTRLAGALAGLEPGERRALAEAAKILERLFQALPGPD